MTIYLELHQHIKKDKGQTKIINLKRHMFNDKMRNINKTIKLPKPVYKIDCFKNISRINFWDWINFQMKILSFNVFAYQILKLRVRILIFLITTIFSATFFIIFTAIGYFSTLLILYIYFTILYLSMSSEILYVFIRVFF